MGTKYLQRLIVFLIICFASGCETDQVPDRVPDEATDKALQIVADPASSTSGFDAAITQLDSFAGDPSFWLKIASDTHFNPNRRRRCIKHFFDRCVSSGMNFGKFLKSIDVPVNWISIDRIQKRPQMAMAGWAPEPYMKGESAFAVPVLPNEGGDYHLTVFISFYRDLKLEDVKRAFDGGIKVHAVENKSVDGFGTWDSDDYEKHYPGSKNRPWPFD